MAQCKNKDKYTVPSQSGPGTNKVEEGQFEGGGICAEETRAGTEIKTG